MKRAQTYETAANAFTALDIADPITGRIKATENALRTFEEIALMDDFYLAVTDGRVVGYFTMEDFEDLADDTRVGDVSNPISPGACVNSCGNYFRGFSSSSLSSYAATSSASLPSTKCLFSNTN